MLILLRTADARIAAHLTAPLAEAGLRLVVEMPSFADGRVQPPEGTTPVMLPKPDALVADLDLLVPPRPGRETGGDDADSADTDGDASPISASGISPGIPPGIPLILLHAATARQESRRVRAAGLPPSARLLRVPFSAGALVTALRAAGLAAPPGRGPLATGVLALGDIVFDPVSGRATRDFRPLSLHPQERLLLELLLRRAGSVVQREDIAHWCLDYATPIPEIDSHAPHAPHAPHAVDVLVSRLRRTLARAAGSGVPGATSGTRLRTVRGVGYRLEAG
ncbi:winged helix-turn-helix domain-containing protein [Nitratidesulfovibrio sp. SRB-5]|uniref:winged helix-turn-helix domain-containing protein n=1 Tax=Nitratidesulfovibrio sp. SRB-5 TaxID=2872636 RepID=UPI0010276ECB|nr:winged helix-turn-helix domain-containing protein [Nitratidesulfovibrio sp. SRB-5]MBZ2171350.1 winged helix-turn-helix domain-containing protein [Nitratidesulfovibrio sp. SRB-5]RXF76875.1 response regulator transcription factor [Desulfovibrio sp. DS-1]